MRLGKGRLLFVEEGGGEAGGPMWDRAKAVILVDRHCPRSDVDAFSALSQTVGFEFFLETNSP
jgi:hypothetical protein